MTDTDTAALALELVDELYAAARVPPGCRVNHARGVLVEGRFRPSVAAPTLSRAPMFGESELPALVRFSSSSGDAAIPEDDAHADPRGLALEIDGQLVLVGHSVEAFPATTPEEFLAFLRALGPDSQGSGPSDDPFREDTSAARFEAMRTSAPASFATRRYHMLHPYRLERADGVTVDGRLSIFGATAGSEAAPPLSVGRNYLDLELVERLRRGPVELTLAFQPVTAANRADDIAAPWSGGTGLVVLGHLVLDALARDQTAQAAMVFDPGRLPDGLAFAGDPMIAVRLEAYGLAAKRRLAGSTEWERAKP